MTSFSSVSFHAKNLVSSSQNSFITLEGYSPSHHDVLLSDVGIEDLNGKIAEALGVTYLGDSLKDPVKEISGIVWEPNRRLFVALTVEFKTKKKDVIFLLDTC